MCQLWRGRSSGASRRDELSVRRAGTVSQRGDSGARLRQIGRRAAPRRAALAAFRLGRPTRRGDPSPRSTRHPFSVDAANREVSGGISGADTGAARLRNSSVAVAAHRSYLADPD